MKKTMMLVAFLLALLCTCGAMAEDLGIQIIGGPDVKTQPLTLDDLQLGQMYTIDGYAQITPQEFLFADFFGQYEKDADYSNVGYWYRVSENVYFEESGAKGDYGRYAHDSVWVESGSNAEFGWFQLDIVNLKKTSINYFEEASVKVVYAEDYEFAGWIRQVNFDYTDKAYRYGGPETVCGTYAVLNPANVEAVEMLYTGTYIFGCTLPNYVVEDKKAPLKMIIDLGGNELTYHIRK